MAKDAPITSMNGEPRTSSAPDDARGLLADELMSLVETLYPTCRSITGDGVRSSLNVLSRYLPMTVHEVPSGTPVLDWTVPDEWNIRDAYIADASGRRIIDFRENNLHVMSYSVAVDAQMSLEALRPHLHTLPDQPDLIPYRTSYYEKSWGFCLTQGQLAELAPGETYDVCIDSTLTPGSLTYGEVIVPGRTSDEILVSAHVCHPSLADDNLSGIAVSAFAARRLLRGRTPRHTHRFLFAPGTIGAITWLARNGDAVARIKHGLTLTCLGDSHPFTYKRTVHGNRVIDRAAALTLAASGVDHHLIDFFPYGYDERQYNSPGFRLPVGSLMRGRHGRFPEYHTSADNLTFVSGERMAESLDVLESLLAMLDAERPLRARQPFGEPQLGRRGLYRAIGGAGLPDLQMAMLWVLCLADGDHGLIDVCERSGIDPATIRACVDLLVAHDLLENEGRPEDAAPS